MKKLVLGAVAVAGLLATATPAMAGCTTTGCATMTVIGSNDGCYYYDADHYLCYFSFDGNFTGSSPLPSGRAEAEIDTAYSSVDYGSCSWTVGGCTGVVSSDGSILMHRCDEPTVYGYGSVVTKSAAGTTYTTGSGSASVRFDPTTTC